MVRKCKNCRHSVSLDLIVNDKSVFVCKEVFYQKTKYDSLKKLKLTSFAPVVSEDDLCSRFGGKDVVSGEG